ncbi:MAG: hypothetical protein FJW79_07100 [Actinobacteria bacterium]|nr:hypothetical protein [Actinomycetota bacterium]
MLVGKWDAEATVPGGGTYTGRVVGRRVGPTVELEWEVTAGHYVGLGLEAAGAWWVACGEDWDGLGLALLYEGGAARWAPAPGRGEAGATTLVSCGTRCWAAGPDTDPGFPFDAVGLNESWYLREAELQGGPAGRGLALPFPGGHAVAWYPLFEQTVILRYGPGREPGTVEAMWGLGGHHRLAAETLRPVG